MQQQSCGGSRRALLGFVAAFGVLGWGLSSAVAAGCGEPSKIEVVSVRRVFDNGEHNAFTDLIRFRDRFFLTFRSCPDGHMVHPSSSIIVLASDDLRDWSQVFRFHVPLRDTRDPHFVVFRDRLFVYTGCWYCGESSPEHYEINQHLGYGVATSDGKHWEGPRMLEGTYGHYIWRAAALGDRVYLCGRRKKEFVETASRAERDPLIQSAMLVSDDGWTWKYHSLFQETFGDETAFLFEPNGDGLGVARSGGGKNAVLLRAAAPYREWRRQDLGRYIGGPLLVKWGDDYLVGGRKTAGGPPVTTLYWLQQDALREAVTLPSGGDNSYPGFVAVSPTRAFVSYYSSHEKDEQGRTRTAIYLAELRRSLP